MHTIIAAHCTGCELCIPVCPVDCIELINVSGEATGWASWSEAQAQHALQRYQGHKARLHQHSDKPAPASTASTATTIVTAPAAATDKKATIAAILAKAKAQRANS